MYPLLFDAESIPGVGFSIWGSREGELKIWKTLTLSGHNSILGRDGVILKLNFSSGNVPARQGFRFFRAHRGRLHPQFGRFLNLNTIFEGERRHLASKLNFTGVIGV